MIGNTGQEAMEWEILAVALVVETCNWEGDEGICALLQTPTICSLCVCRVEMARYD